MKIISTILALLLYVTAFSAPGSSSMMINVEAGTSQTICYGETLDLDLLGASISGDVSDGIWFTTGDGIFLPGNSNNGVFSTTDQYQPGPQDQSNGSFTLILVSDDPDGNGPMVEVSDEVEISFMNAPALVCNTSINVSLAEGCEQAVDIFMLLANPAEPYTKYIIELYDENDVLIPNNVLTVDHLGTDVSFVVGHDCTSNSCGGDISVTDNIAPFLNCVDADVECEFGVNPESVGLPIPFYAIATAIDDNTYLVEDFDACGDVTLTFQDIEVEMACASTGYIKEITRSWVAEDDQGNSSTCEQIILVRPLPLSAVMTPPNYDGTDELPLECDGDWEALPDGHPSPASTGMPSFPDCGNIDGTYMDVEFEECGDGFKVLRQWFIIDWCTTQTLEENQVIKILDQQGPVFECPEDLVLSSHAYECINEPYELSFVDSVYDCSMYDSSFQILTLEEVDISMDFIVDGNRIEGLPVGEYFLLYVATDVCGNASQCTTSLEVIDDTAPFAVCDGFTQVAVSSNGIADLLAISLDDGSFDNCGNIIMEVAKMTDECAWGLDFGPKVHFCCEEIGDTTMVAFRVTDDRGLSNTCMVSVFIEDKLPPSIVCPSDLTISCAYHFDPDDLSIFGSVVEGEGNEEPILINGQELGIDGYFEDNCAASVEEESIINLDCGAGIITRTFTATDLFGQTASCTQTITVASDNPFLESDILWPGNFEMNGCDTIQADPSITGLPTWENNKCALVAAEHKDQIFYISGGACVKILREWTVIDWCQYDVGQNIGIWTYLQEIKLKNTIAPEFVECEDQEICSYDENCTSELVTITAYANDDCTDSLDLFYQWSLDIDDDGTVDEFGQGIEFTRELLYGEHRVFWTVEDGCGNAETCNYKLTVRDCKNPTPYCTSSITTTIMPSSGMIDIWAVDYNYGSFDNCTAPEDLIFSFSQDVTDDNRVISCEDIENGVAQEFTFELWVTDEYGNQDRCEVSFIVQDNSDACPNGTIKGKIEGRVMSHRDDYIPNVELNYTASIDTFSGMKLTDGLGEFVLDTIPEYLKYIFKPSFESEPLSGVNTLDLVLIQRHILELAPFDNPYDIMASDVTGNEKVSSADLLTLRKLILGIISDWPQGVDEWVFVDSSFVFFDEEQPWYYPDSIVIDKLGDSVEHVDFVAVKMGDVNGSYQPGLQNERNHSTTRNNEAIPVLFSKKNEGDNYSYDLIFEELDDIPDGLQLSFQVPEKVVLTSEYLSESDFSIIDNVLRISWVNTRMKDIQDIPFLTLTVANDKEISLLQELKPEIYIDLNPLDLQVEFKENQPLISEDVKKDLSIYAIQNPFDGDLNIKVEGSYTQMQITMLDTRGQLIYSGQYHGTNEIIIPDETFSGSGLYWVRALIDDHLQTLKVIKL
ncbi:MAG: dockerin type I domain-containing protein [Bacteroidota bacterium]